MPQRHKEDT